MLPYTSIRDLLYELCLDIMLIINPLELCLGATFGTDLTSLSLTLA